MNAAPNGRPSARTRHRALGALALVVAAVGALVAADRGLLTRALHTVEPPARRIGSPPAGEHPTLRPGVVGGRARTEVVAGAGRGAEAGAAPLAPAGVQDAPQAPGSPAGSDGRDRKEVAAIAPGWIRDLVAATGQPWVSVLRSDVVGRMGPGGQRDVATPGVFRWTGVARIERDDRAPSEASDDTREPATTAVRGLVVAEDGSPIRGAEVLLYSSFYLRQDWYDHRVRQVGRALTGDDGAFDLRPVDLDTVHFGGDGEVLVTVRHPHYPDLVAQPVGGIVPGRESPVVRLTLPVRGTRVRGRIFDLAGKPVAGAVVRLSGVFNPVEYDKTERMVVLDACPFAVTDEQGAYALEEVVGGEHEISVHIRIDCVLHVRDRWEGEREWNAWVRAGNAVRGLVVDPDGAPVAAAVVAGGGNWTPTNPDGTFWLDNVTPGPLRLEVSHHAWRTVRLEGVATNADPVRVALADRLPRVTLEVVDLAGAPVPLLILDWLWPEGAGPGPFAPDSRFWHDPGGVFLLTVPEGARGARLGDGKGWGAELTTADLVDGARRRVVIGGAR